MQSFFRAVFGGFLGGVTLASLVPTVVHDVTAIFFLIGAVMFVCLYAIFHDRRLVVAAVCAASAVLGVVRLSAEDAGVRAAELAPFVGETVEIIGIVTEEPDARDARTLLSVSAERVAVMQGEERGARGGVLVSTPRNTEWRYGDRVIVSGKLELPKNFFNENGREFDYVSYLKKDGISYRMYARNARIIGRGEGNYVREVLFSAKRAFLDSVAGVLPEPHASLVGGLLVGAKESLGEKLLDDFRAVGLVHIVVLSGYNVTIVALAIMWMLRFLPRRMSLAAGALSIAAFAAMTGGGATVARASLMALLVLLARATGRVYDITRALFIAGFVMVFVNPDILVFDLSFQLSFLATMGLLYLPPLWERFFTLVPNYLVRELILATISTQVFVLPLLLYAIGDMSLLSLPANLLVLPVIPFAMLFGFLAGVSGMISGMIAAPFAWVAYAVLSYVFFIVKWIAAVPFASFAVPFFPFPFLILSYAALGYYIMTAKNHATSQKIENEE